MINNFSPLVSSPSLNSKTAPLSLSIKKCKDGTGDNWSVSVEPGQPPFYLISNDPPVQEAYQTGAKNLISLNGLEASYQKFCTKKLKDELSAFLPNVCGRVNVPSIEDDSGLLDLIMRPPVQGKELRLFAQTQLDHAFRLHPGPLPQEFANLFSSVSNIEKSFKKEQDGFISTNLNQPTSSDSPMSTKKRRREIHHANINNIQSNPISQIGHSSQTLVHSDGSHSRSQEVPPGLIPVGSAGLMAGNLPSLMTLPGTSVHSAPRAAPNLISPIPGTLDQNYPSNIQTIPSNSGSYPNPPQLHSLVTGSIHGVPSPLPNSALLKPGSHLIPGVHNPPIVTGVNEIPSDELMSNTISLLNDDEPGKKRKRKKEKKRRDRD